MKILNYSAEPVNKLFSWLPRDLEAEKVIFFPDACPGRSPLPTGTVVFTRQQNWRKFAVSDCGCGMLLVKSTYCPKDFSKATWDKIYYELRNKKGKLGDLGSGNHFLDALVTEGENYLYFLIHTGSRTESKIVDHLTDRPDEFDQKFGEVCSWAEANRLAIAQILENYFGPLETITDRNHNHFEKTNEGVILRKGAVKIHPHELTVLPSNLIGDIVLVKATQKVEATLFSLNHGTGRIMARSEAKLHAEDYNYHKLREHIYIPEMISNASIKTEAPYCYRNLEDCLELIHELITVEKRFKPIAYLGQI
ncbi:MAG: RtcB family protein [Marinifilaceae bacterium]